MSSISDRIQAVKARYDMREYVAAELDISGAITGHVIKIVCPFHGDTDPSLGIYADGYYCYACGERGDILDWVQKRGAADLRTALEMLEGPTPFPANPHLGLPKPKPQLPQESVLGKQRLEDALETLFAEGIQGLAGSPAEKYCLTRGWSERTQEAFELGFFDYRAAIKDEAALEELGLLNRDGWTWFNNRLFIPLRDPFGNAVAIATRKLAGGVGARYINSRRSPLFKRNELLYGAHLLGKAERGHIWVVEGYADVWSLYELGVPAVAIMTARVSELQVEWLALMAQSSGARLVLAFDGDQSGKEGQWEAYTKLARYPNVNVTRIQLPDGEDVSSIIERYGEGAFAKDLGYLDRRS